jgi:hypothetical protein
MYASYPVSFDAAFTLIECQGKGLVLLSGNFITLTRTQS